MNRNLDCLRAFAVLLVLAGHAAAFSGTLGPYGPFRLITLGGLGVLLFFVHTSLVLMQSLEREPGAVSFYVRRIFRIYPLAIAAMLLVMIFRIPQASINVGHFAGFSPDFGDVVSNLALMQNFSMRAPVLGPTWSLSYELQMYVLLPALFALVTSLRRALILYAVTLTLALGVNRYSSSINLLSFAPCFLSGILLYRIGKRRSWTLPAWGCVLPGVGPRAASLGTLEPNGEPNPLMWEDPITENPDLGATEVWEVHNTTEDAHAIHIHQVQFQIVDREDSGGKRRGPELPESGFKDTVIAYPGEITRVRAKFDIPGTFVWHCHMLDHEDNEMMRPYKVG